MATALFLSSLDSETGTRNITCFVPGVGQNSCDDTHPNFQAIFDVAEAAIRDGIEADESVLDLFDVAEAVSKRFEQLSERVAIRDGRVYFDGDEIDNAATRQIVRFLESGYDFEPLVAFLENLAANPNDHSREQLYTWLEDRDFTITQDGYIVGYKGVRLDGKGGYQSISSGPGVVDGVEHNGHLPNNPGSVVELARSNVQHDPGFGCSVGLHVGTWEYARGFSRDAVLKVLVNPRDVVSVPTDCDAQKMRVCRYIVVEPIEEKVAYALDPDFEEADEAEESWANDQVYV